MGTEQRGNSKEDRGGGNKGKEREGAGPVPGSTGFIISAI